MILYLVVGSFTVSFHSQQLFVGVLVREIGEDFMLDKNTNYRDVSLASGSLTILTGFLMAIDLIYNLLCLYTVSDHFVKDAESDYDESIASENIETSEADITESPRPQVAGIFGRKRFR